MESKTKEVGSGIKNKKRWKLTCHYRVTYTEYGVKIRYPIEAMIEETHVAKALSDMKIVCDYVESELQKKIVETNND